MAAGPYRFRQKFLAASLSIFLIPGAIPLASGNQEQQGTESAKIPPDQLDSLVAPIALYPDPLLAQVLAASTYPLEIMELQQWLTKNKSLSGKELTDAAMKEDWDPSVQALAALPDVANRLANDIKWTTDLGNAFLAQQSEVMDAVQRMRAKAQSTGNLKSSEQQKVETQVIENKSTIVIQPSDPQVVYVPSYNPTVVYGPPVYPYPPVAYPPPGYYAAGMAISFGVGMAMGAAWGGGWGWGCGWGGNNNITINNNNNFVRNSNRQSVNSNRQNVGNRTGGNNWSHNPQHRGGAPYSNRATANKFGGGSYRGESAGSRQARARQQQVQTGQRQGGDRAGQGQRQGIGGGGQAGAGNRGAGGAGGVGSNRAGAGAGGDRIGDRSVSSGAASRGGGALGGSGGMSGSSARASSARGSSSMGGGRSRGGGGGRRR